MIERRTPDTAHNTRSLAAVCMPSSRMAALGGRGAEDELRKDGEAFLNVCGAGGIEPLPEIDA